MRFWKNRTSRINGTEMTTDAAEMLPNGTSCSVAPVKNAIAAGTVRAFDDEVSVTASRNSFHAKMNVRIPAVASPGAASGMTTLRNAVKRVAPSTSAPPRGPWGSL